jgi:RNA polymerase sigma factor (sigma-70 family)
MAGAGGTPLQRALSGFWAGVPDPADSDAQLLERFLAGSEPAFAAIVRRHGPMVSGVCRRVLGHRQDAEDAFQAAFMVLSRRAGSIRKSASLASWLYGVAYRVACKARRARVSRMRERRSDVSPRLRVGLTEGPDAAWRELCAILDEELNRLPERYRAALVLCYLEGKSNEEAAQQLGCTKGTVSSRIWRGRALLRDRLARRGLTLSGGAAVGLFAVGAVSAAVPGRLVHDSVQAALAFSVRTAANGKLVTPAAILAQEVMRTMFWTKHKLIVSLILAMAFSVGGGSLLLGKVLTAPPQQLQAGGNQVAENAQAGAPDAPAGGKRDVEADKRKSTDNLKHIGLAMHGYHNDFKHFPPAAILGKDKKALLSWRVAILPYLDEDVLFKEFKLDEAWDSPHNKKLLARMPKVYAPPGIKTPQPHSTFYRVFVGPGTVFENPQGNRIADITDGSSNTLLVAEAGAAVPWTKPEELPYDKNKALPALGGLFDGDFYASVVDASVVRVSRKADARLIHLFIQRNDGNALNLGDLRKEEP